MIAHSFAVRAGHVHHFRTHDDGTVWESVRPATAVEVLLWDHAARLRKVVGEYPDDPVAWTPSI